MEFSILIVDDEKNIRSGLAKYLQTLKYVVHEASNGKEAMDLLLNNRNKIDLVITDLRMPVISGEELLTNIVKEFQDKIEIVIMTGHGTIENAVQAMQSGANDFLTKPINLDHLELVLKRIRKNKEIRKKYLALQQEVLEQKKGLQIIGHSYQMSFIMETVQRVAPSNASILITGESGVGKEVVADSIHSMSKRSDGPLIKVHCASLSESLLESELFGHEKGAFTGASARKIGRFEMANRGTIFLDEIGEINPSVQIKLLRVLQEKIFERVGGQESIKVDVRIISATNRNLEEEIVKKNFREDLYYRLNVIKIEVPPLRERKEDIPLIIASYLKLYAKENEKEVDGIEDDALKALYNYPWPGNIRELKNYIESAVIMCKGNIIKLGDLPPMIKSTQQASINIPIGISLKEAEKQIIKSTLEYYDNNKSKASNSLGIERKTLYKKLEDESYEEGS